MARYIFGLIVSVIISAALFYAMRYAGHRVPDFYWEDIIIAVLMAIITTTVTCSLALRRKRSTT
jgi:membrane protein DedA with SNARE-associated domain